MNLLYYGLSCAGSLLIGILIGYLLVSRREQKHLSGIAKLDLTVPPQTVNLEVLERGDTHYDVNDDAPGYIPEYVPKIY